MSFRLGVCIYPHLIASDFDIENYLVKCKKSNINLIFTTLINYKKSDTEKIKIFQRLTSQAKKLNMDIYGDVNGHVLDEFGIDKTNKTAMMNFFYNELGLSGIRFDEGVSGPGVAGLSNNELDMKIILNATEPGKELEYILSANANIHNLYSCWNFYPQRYTASSIEFFENRVKYIKSNNVRVQAFCTIQRPEAQGPWKYNDKLPSLEIHRDLSLDFQIRHLMSMNVDDILVSNQFLNDEEFKEIASINLHKPTLKVDLINDLSENEKTILFDTNIHFVRPDIAEYIVRSTLTRIKYQDLDILPHSQDVEYFEPGDVVILNNNAQNYKGELHIVLKRMKNDNIRNLVGKLDQYEQLILNNLQPYSEFMLAAKN